MSSNWVNLVESGLIEDKKDLIKALISPGSYHKEGGQLIVEQGHQTQSYVMARLVYFAVSLDIYIKLGTSNEI